MNDPNRFGFNPEALNDPEVDYVGMIQLVEKEERDLRERARLAHEAKQAILRSYHNNEKAKELRRKIAEGELAKQHLEKLEGSRQLQIQSNAILNQAPAAVQVPSQNPTFFPQPVYYHQPVVQAYNPPLATTTRIEEVPSPSTRTKPTTSQVFLQQVLLNNDAPQQNVRPMNLAHTMNASVGSTRVNIPVNRGTSSLTGALGDPSISLRPNHAHTQAAGSASQSIPIVHSQIERQQATAIQPTYSANSTNARPGFYSRSPYPNVKPSDPSSSNSNAVQNSTSTPPAQQQTSPVHSNPEPNAGSFSTTQSAGTTQSSSAGLNTAKSSASGATPEARAETIKLVKQVEATAPGNRVKTHQLGHLYKDVSGKLFLFPLGQPRMETIISTTVEMQKQFRGTLRNLYRNSNGDFVFFDVPPTGDDALAFKRYDPPFLFSGSPHLSIPVENPTPVPPSNQIRIEQRSGPIIRDEIETKTLARDLMRALGKRGRESLDSGDREGTKKQATLGVVSARLPATQAFSATVDSLSSPPNTETNGVVKKIGSVDGSTLSTTSHQPEKTIPPPLPKQSEPSYVTTTSVTPPRVVITPQIAKDFQEHSLLRPILPSPSTNDPRPENPRTPSRNQSSIESNAKTSRTKRSSQEAVASSQSPPESSLDLSSVSAKQKQNGSPVTLSQGDATGKANDSVIDMGQDTEPLASSFTEYRTKLPGSSPSPRGSPKEALFLPSSPSGSTRATPQPSPEPNDNASLVNDQFSDDADWTRRIWEDSNEGSDGAGPSNASANHKRAVQNRAYVLVPPLPRWVVRQGKKRRLSPPNPEGRLDAWGIELEDGYSDVDLADPAAKQSMTLLSPTKCAWQDCDLTLNSGDALRRHLMLHQKEPANCGWRYCLRSFRKGVDFQHHLGSHVPLTCHFSGCDSKFYSVEALHSHLQTHDKETRLKQSSLPFKSDVRTPPPLPKEVPFYLLEPIIVKPAIIPAARRLELGPLVTKLISGPVNPGTKKLLAAAPLQDVDNAPRPGEPLGAPRRHEYDFVERFESTGKPLKSMYQFEDLDCVEVSQDVNYGYGYWNLPLEETEGIDVEIEPQFQRFASVVDEDTGEVT